VAQEEAADKAKQIEADANAKNRHHGQLQEQIQQTLKDVKLKYILHVVGAYVLAFIVAGM